MLLLLKQGVYDQVVIEAIYYQFEWRQSVYFKGKSCSQASRIPHFVK